MVPPARPAPSRRKALVATGAVLVLSLAIFVIAGINVLGREGESPPHDTAASTAAPASAGLGAEPVPTVEPAIAEPPPPATQAPSATAAPTASVTAAPPKQPPNKRRKVKIGL